MAKSILRFFTLICFIQAALLQAQDFTWKKGSSQTGQKGYYGIKGVSSPSNIPGARAGATYWQDAAGGFWFFGGEGKDYVGNSGILSDLWLYTLSTNEWTWMGGTDFIAQIGIYGTKGVASSNNRPGGRTGAVSWVDVNGKFWIFGGYGYDSQASMGYLSDLWKFDPLTGHWTWINGPDLCNQSGTYGTQGSTSPGVGPGARTSAIAWKANNGNLYLFGGMGYNNLTTVGSLNDLWMYNISNDQWTWVNGGNGINQSGTYGTLGTPSALNAPGARKSATGWKDNAGNFWMLGGFGKDAASTTSSYLNDLWKYDVPANQWTWVRGSNAADAAGVYGTPGVSSSTNEPGARAEGASWVDVNGTFWLLGGEGFASTGLGKLNDLWMYNSISNIWTWVKSSSIAGQNGFYGTMGVPGVTNRPGGRNQTCSWIDSKNNLYLFGGEGFGQSTTPEGPLNDLWKYTNCFISPISLTITSQDSSICAGESTSLTVVGSNNYLWMHNLSTLSYVVIKPAATTQYTVSTSNDNSCIYSATFTQSVSACQGLADNNSVGDGVSLYPNPNQGVFTIRTNERISGCLTIMNALGQEVYRVQLGSEETKITGDLRPGVYFYRISGDNVKDRTGKLIIE